MTVAARRPFRKAAGTGRARVRRLNGDPDVVGRLFVDGARGGLAPSLRTRASLS